MGAPMEASATPSPPANGNGGMLDEASAQQDLIDDNVVEFTGVFTSESYIVHRLVGQSEYSAQIRWQDQRPDANSTDWYYVRVTQNNGQLAWSSPIWVG